MSLQWPSKRLSEIADIRVSNVDKKTYDSEKSVKLCNYMDVYSNEYVSSRLDFMEASATPAEIDRFGLNCGDVVITKDSETPDDIGIAAMIAETIENLVCGYHLALIRPVASELDSVYLAKQLSTSRVSRHFALSASGSTRYSLSISAIESVTIPMPAKPEQTKIAEILSTVDRAIEQTEALIAKQERIKTGLMQDLLTRGIDEHGNIRSESTHKFKDSPLGRIPVEWEVRPSIAICRQIVVGIVIRPVQYYKPDGIPVLRSANVRENCIDPSNLVYMSAKDNEALAKSQLFTGDLVTVRTGYPGTTAVVSAEFNGCNCVDVVISRPEHGKVRSSFLSIWINSDLGKRQVLEGQGGLAQQHFNVGAMKSLLVKLPGLPEQQRIEESLKAQRSVDDHLHGVLAKCCALKTALMQDLLTGRKRVTPLLELERNQ